MSLTRSEIESIVDAGVAAMDVAGRRVILIVPDNTRTCPIDVMFELLHDRMQDAAKLDVLIALGTHEPLSAAEIDQRMGTDPASRAGKYSEVSFFNHAWDDSDALMEVGTIEASEIATLTNGAFDMDVAVTCNKMLADYDLALILGPVFPHEVAGFSGGNKYLFPGVSGPEVLNFFHWLGALITNHDIIGTKCTPVRKVIDRSASLVPVERRAFCMVVEKGGGLLGLYHGTPEDAWSTAADHSAQVHIHHTGRQFSTVLSCAPTMYPDLWTGGKCMYKLEPVVADGGTLIIYAPHITEVSAVHGELLAQIGYHCRDYFTAQWAKFEHFSWGVLAHSTHVKGAGTYVGGVERPRVKVELATGISAMKCAKINLGYRDPATVRLEDFAEREDEGVLLVERAGEILYRP